MHDYILKQLDQVTVLHQQRMQVIKQIKNTTKKRIGMIYLPVTSEEKVIQINKTNKFYNTKIDRLYNNMNAILKNAGIEELINPYQKRGLDDEPEKEN